MNRFWLNTLAVSLGVLAPVAYAADPAPVATLDRPVAVTAPAAAPAAVLERPIGIANNPPAPLPIVDRQVRPIGFSDGDSPIIRGQIPDTTLARPMPVGSAPISPGIAANTWRRYDDPGTQPEVAPPPSKVLPPPAPESAPVVIDDGGGSWLSQHNPFAHSGGWLSHLNPFAWGDDCGACTGGLCTGGACPAGACPAGACPAGGDCGVDCCGRGGAYPGNRFYVSAEYLLWWVKGQPVPPLVTSGSLSDPIPGALGAPGTNVLFGGHNIDDGAQSGGRFMAGYWFCDDHSLGIEGGYFFLVPGTRNFSASSGGTPILARPFTDATTGTQTAELVAGPKTLSGTVSAQTRTSLWGAEANLRSTVCGGCNWYLDFLTGFRTMGLDEDLIVHENLTVLRPGGGTFDIVDHFQTRNRFYGGQIGADWQCQKGRWDFDVKTKLGLGVTQQMVNISGNDTINDPTTGVTTFPGGLLTQPTNIGSHTRDRFTYVPEVGFTVAYHLTDHLRVFAGYNFIYWSSVVRPGAQIDTTVNQNQIAPPVAGGPARPAFTFNGSDFWAQGVNVGLEYKW